jgi:signal peptidase I
MASSMRLASVAAMILVLLGVWLAINGTFVGAFGAILFGVAAYQLYRDEPWGGFGPALFLTTAATALAANDLLNKTAEHLGLATICLLLTAIFFRAGQQLRQQQRSNSGRQGWILATVALAVFPALAFAAFSTYRVPSGGMDETLKAGEQLLVVRTSSFERGDLIVFRDPQSLTQRLVSRIIGIKGDRIQIVSKQLVLNGKLVEEPYAHHRTNYIDRFRDNFPHEPGIHIHPGLIQMLVQNVVNGEVVVPANSYFVLGDNRDYSVDSRLWGIVPYKAVLGKPFLIYDSEIPERKYQRVIGFSLAR